MPSKVYTPIEKDTIQSNILDLINSNKKIIKFIKLNLKIYDRITVRSIRERIDYLRKKLEAIGNE